MTWEYHIERDVDFSPFWENHYLRELGAKGWELMTSVPHEFPVGCPHYTLLFKRPTVHIDATEAAATYAAALQEVQKENAVKNS